MSTLALTLASLLTMTSAAPATTPPSASADRRLQVVDYDPDAVLPIIGRARTATQVQFAGDETVLHVALGDTAGWEIAVEDNLLFLKPRADAARTNLIVTTRGSAGRRIYHFELSLQSARGAPPVFALRFRYPSHGGEDDRLARLAEALQRRLVELKLDRAVVEGRRNLAYGLRGDDALQPSEVTDNGRFTVLRFPGGQALPAIYQVTEGGEEALIPFDVRGEFVVVHAVVRELRLRRGKAMLCVLNQAYAPAGAPATGTGTTASDVVRTDKGSSDD